MQVLVGQMYCSGYGIPKDENKVHFFALIFLGLGCFLIVLLELI